MDNAARGRVHGAGGNAGFPWRLESVRSYAILRRFRAVCMLPTKGEVSKMDADYRTAVAKSGRTIRVRFD